MGSLHWCAALKGFYCPDRICRHTALLFPAPTVRPVKACSSPVRNSAFVQQHCYFISRGNVAKMGCQPSEEAES